MQEVRHLHEVLICNMSRHFLFVEKISIRYCQVCVCPSFISPLSGNERLFVSLFPLLTHAGQVEGETLFPFPPAPSSGQATEKESRSLREEDGLAASEKPHTQQV